MEAISEFKTALKKTVIMFNTMTGKDLTEEEGSIFINLLDMTEGYQSTTTSSPDSAVVVSGSGHSLDEAIASMRHQIEATPLKGLPEEFSQAPAAAVVDDYVAQPITTSRRDHIQGYDWQIVVLSREKDPSDSYVVHFAYQPTQEQFEEHFTKFVDRTHYVHVNEWDRLRDDWVGVTSHYANTYQDRSEHNPRWEQADMAYRVRYYDRETGQLTFKYVPRKPSGNELATYHHIKGFAVVQSKVA